MCTIFYSLLLSVLRYFMIFNSLGICCAISYSFLLIHDFFSYKILAMPKIKRFKNTPKFVNGGGSSSITPAAQAQEVPQQDQALILLQ